MRCFSFQPVKSQSNKHMFATSWDCEKSLGLRVRGLNSVSGAACYHGAARGGSWGAGFESQTEARWPGSHMSALLLRSSVAPK